MAGEASGSTKPMSLLNRVAFGSTMLASSCMNNVFVTYYVQFYALTQLMPPSWFYIAQILFG